MLFSGETGLTKCAYMSERNGYRENFKIWNNCKEFLFVCFPVSTL